MIDGINSNSQINWYTLLNSQRKQTSSLAWSVSDGSDTAEISGQIFKTAGSNERKNPLEQLVNDGTITSDQAAAIDEALRCGEPGEDPLASLISAGTITQDQADSVKSALDASRPGGGDKGFLSNTLDNLVLDGTITEDQADAVKQALSARGPQGAPPPPPPVESADSSSGESDATVNLDGMTEEEILALLSSGDITAQQALSAIQNLQSQEAEEAGATVPGVTQSDYAADPLYALVASGTLTQDQADAIKSAFTQANTMNRALKAYAVSQ